MDEINKRLSETSAACLKAYEAWNSNKKDGKAREALQESVHELRKVASRLEIEVAVSERDEMTQKPIPIPPHRDSGKKGRDNDNRGNKAEKGNDAPKARKPVPNKKADDSEE